MKTYILCNGFTSLCKRLALVAALAVSSGSVFAADDHGNDMSTATSVTIGRNVPGKMDGNGDIDYFKFTVPANGQVLLAVANSMADVFGVLLDAQGNIIQKLENPTANGFSIVQMFKSGTYYLAVAAYDPNATGRYAVCLRFSPSR